ncbi:hypothetical protein J4436_03450 [Candidatus Woesearchaeota archaeon]|nr:hypothetical protein [Candidatus Woesearchaeota archaeon]
MASIMDTSALAYFLPVVVFLFIFVAAYAFLQKSKIFGENVTKLNLVAAFCIGLLSIFIGNLSKVIAASIPWLFFVVIVLIMVFGTFIFFGYGEKPETAYREIWEMVGSSPVYIIMLVIVFIAITQVFDATLSPYSTGEDGETTPTSETVKTLTHPRMLSALFLLIIASVVVRFLVDKVK